MQTTSTRTSLVSQCGPRLRLYDHDFDSWQRNTRPSRAPTDVEQRLMELGHDFFGLMKTARHFVGFALLAQPDVETLRVESDDFDFNEFAALVTLTSAFDRLRDFIIVATQNKKTEARDQFARAIELLRACGLKRTSRIALEPSMLPFARCEKRATPPHTAWEPNRRESNVD